jgi:adenylate kinase family enzyme
MESAAITRDAALPPAIYRRIVIVGASGAGKSSLAAEIADILKIPCFELDQHANSNQPAGLQEYVRTIAGLEAWIVPADYTSIRNSLWPHAEAVIWLDYPLAFSMTRLARREFSPGLVQKALSKRTYTNFWSKTLTMLQTFRRSYFIHRRNRRNLKSLLQKSEYSHLVLIRFKNPSQTSSWVRYLSISCLVLAAGKTVGEEA